MAKTAGDHFDNWIAAAVPPSHRGLLHKKLGVSQGQKIPAGKINAAARKGGKLGQEARFAKNMKGLGK